MIVDGEAGVRTTGQVRALRSSLVFGKIAQRSAKNDGANDYEVARERERDFVVVRPVPQMCPKTYTTASQPASQPSETGVSKIS